jgi:hypothetical protein
MAKRFLMNVSLDGDSGDVTGILDRLQIVGVRIPHLTIKDGESTEHRALPREQRPRPDSSNPVRAYAVAIVVPGRFRSDIGDVERLSPIHGRAAGRAPGADQREP